MDAQNSPMVNKMLSVANKISTQKHMMAIRDAFIALMPATIIASFWVLVNNLLLSPTNGLFKSVKWLTDLSAIGNQIYNATLGILAILVAFTIGEKLAENYQDDSPMFGGVFGVICFFIMLPAQLKIATVDGKMVIVPTIFSQTQVSATGMFLAIIASMIGVTLLCKFNQNAHLRIKMPDAVPPAIAKSFNVLIPAFLVSTIFGALEFAIETGLHTNAPDLIVKFFQAPLVGSFQSIFVIIFYVFLSNFLWAFGLHGPFILGGISGPVLTAAIQQNMDALKAGKALPNIVTQPFLDIYGWMGGGGVMMCLVIAILIGSRREDYRTIAKVGLVPAFFNVSEPIQFGLPVVFNPILGIPLIIAPVVTVAIGYGLTAIGWVSRTSVIIPWTTPPIISGYLATNGDIRAAIIQVFLLAIGTLIYLPFVRFANRQKIVD